MAWCIATSSVDLDVDVLFQENSTIGQKIKISESVIRAIVKMRCALPLQAHQIQGQDYVNIFPVVQWLVKKSIEAREGTADFARQYSESQFAKNFALPVDSQRMASRPGSIDFLESVAERYKPKRQFKQTVKKTQQSEEQRAQATILEYGRSSRVGRAEELSEEEKAKRSKKEALLKGHGDAAGKKDAEDEQAKEEARIRELMSKLDQIDHNASGRISSSTLGSIMTMQSEAIRLATSDYLEQTRALGMNEEKAQRLMAEETHRRMVASLEKQINNADAKVRDLQTLVAEQQQQFEQAQAELQKRIAYNERIVKEIERLDAMETPENTKDLTTLRSLFALNESLKKHEAEFKANCKRQMAELKANIEKLASNEPNEDTERMKAVEDTFAAEIARLQKARLLLNHKNRDLVQLQRKIDDIPTRTELIQYERRFVELYDQVSAKLVETRKYYFTYNSQEEIKSLLTKEISLMNSVHDEFEKAMSNKAKREKFLESFEGIITSVKSNLEKITARCKAQKDTRDGLNQTYLGHVEKQRAYFAAVKEFQIECRRNEELRAKLPENQQPQQ